MQTTYQRTGDTTYSGWSNHETWLASLWLNNDEWGYQTLLEAYRHGEESYDHAEWLEGVMRSQLDEEATGPSVWCDLMQTAFSRIEWRELIDNNKP